MIEKLIQKYGKQLIGELIDGMIISKKFDNEKLRFLLIKHEVIKQTTKTIKSTFYRFQSTGRRPDGTWGLIDDYKNQLTIFNGRNATVIFMVFLDSELPHIEEVLND